MNTQDIVAALALPPEALVNLRVPKTVLLEHGAPTPADKRRLREGIEELTWVAALKPVNSGISPFQTIDRQYLEIAVLSVTLRAGAKAARLIELIHRAVPYPVVLLATDSVEVTVSLAHKRSSQAESEQTVVETLTTLAFGVDSNPLDQAFLKSLSLARMPVRDIYSVYQGWIDRFAALDAARITGAFRVPGSPDASATRRAALEEHDRLQREIAMLRNRAAREKQMNRRVKWNLEIKRLEGEVSRVRSTL